MKKIAHIVIMALGLTFVSSCDLDLQVDPNNLTPDTANPDFLLNSIEYGFNEYFFELTDYTMEAARMVAMEPRAAAYESAFQAVDFDDMWEQAYVGVMSDARNLIGLAEENELFVHAGIARTIQAYTLISLVDFFGDVPLSTAFAGSENLTPTLDEGSSVYGEAERLLDLALDNFAATSVKGPANDLFYNGDTDKWAALVNTLKLRIALTTRLVDDGAAAKINTLAAGTLIEDASGDWEYPFSTNTTTTPDSRHPYFSDNYGGAADYMANYYMNKLLTDKSIPDPRTRYYFYRQTLDISSDVNELPCIVEPRPGHYPADMVFCNAGDGYWGRDHLDDDGIPPDNQLRTVFGMYPVGGKFDADDGKLATFGDGLQGAGIHPLMQSSWVKFMLAEAALTMGTEGDPKALLEEGVRGSLDKVLSFAPETLIDADFAPTEDDVETYVSDVLAAYDAATTDEQRLNVIINEYYIALYGNGLEAYNNYRRTGMPLDMQLPLNDPAGPFIRSFLYPGVVVNRNRDIPAKPSVSVQVFWDNNPADFVR
jgi:hypothetical protein